MIQVTTMWNLDGSNSSDDWKAQYQYVSGNVNKNNKIENLEQTFKQRQNQSYKRNMRARRNSWKNQMSLEKTDSYCCQCNCQNQKKVDKPMMPILSDKAQKKQNKSFATKRISQKETKTFFHAKEFSKEKKIVLTKFIPKQKVILEQNPIENKNQGIVKPIKAPFVPYIKNYPLRGPKQVWVPKSV